MSEGSTKGWGRPSVEDLFSEAEDAVAAGWCEPIEGVTPPPGEGDCPAGSWASPSRLAHWKGSPVRWPSSRSYPVCTRWTKFEGDEIVGRPFSCVFFLALNIVYRSDGKGVKWWEGMCVLLYEGVYRRDVSLDFEEFWKVKVRRGQVKIRFKYRE